MIGYWYLLNLQSINLHKYEKNKYGNIRLLKEYIFFNFSQFRMGISDFASYNII